MPEKRKLQLPKKTTNQIKVSGYHSIEGREAQTVKVVTKHQLPKPKHGVANEPGDRLSTTHRDKRAWTNHRNDRLNRQTGSNESMETRD